VSEDVPEAYKNAHPALRESLNISLTIVEFGLPLTGIASAGYDYYSGENFVTYPTSIPGVLGYVVENSEKEENEE
jgi:hypothetical protein